MDNNETNARKNGRRLRCKGRKPEIREQNVLLMIYDEDVPSSVGWTTLKYTLENWMLRGCTIASDEFQKAPEYPKRATKSESQM